jgi:hypothetical protein
MKRFRFHLGTLVILTLLLGVGFAALRESNEMWDSSILSITLAGLMTSMLLAIHRTDERRAFWLGFALFGWTYLGLSLVPSIESRLLTSKVLAYLDSKVPRSSPAGLTDLDPYFSGSWDGLFVNNPQPNALVLNKGNGDWIVDVTAAGSNPTIFRNILAGRTVTWFGTTENFIRIGHSLAAMIVALLGGYISRRLYANNREVVEESIIPQGPELSKRSGG